MTNSSDKDLILETGNRKLETSSPVALITFNRPEHTARVLDAVAAARPETLYFFADGPRPDRPDDIPKCEAVRALVERIDWECDLRTNFSDRNLGCKYGPIAAIDWIFETAGEAIILEDDCLPHPSFFTYCDEMLDRYRADERVMMLSGYNYFGSSNTEYSYEFSLLGSTWGWATWRRAWRLNDPELKNWTEGVDIRLIENLFPDPVHSRFWMDIFDRIMCGRLPDAWDYQWMFSCWMNSGYRIVPSVNLISNIGFGENATHTFGENPFDNRPGDIQFPLRHPPYVVRSFESDRELVEVLCEMEGLRPPPPATLTRRIGSRIKRELSGLLRG